MIFQLGYIITGLAFIASIYRLWKGPHVADRVVAFDLLTAAILVLLALLAIQESQTFYLDILVGLALLSFTSTLAFAYFLEKKRGQEC